MLSPSHAQPAFDINALKHDIQHDIEDIEVLDEFLADDLEECVHVMLGNAGCFY